MQVCRTDVEQYCGDFDKLPCVEMTLRAASEKAERHDLHLPVTLIGAQEPENTFKIIRLLEGTYLLSFYYLMILLYGYGYPVFLFIIAFYVHVNFAHTTTVLPA